VTRGLVAVTIVTFHSARFIRRCLEYVLQQDYERLEVIVVDNASTDGTAAILSDFADRVRIVLNRENVGFAAGQNQAMAMSDAEWVLTLNPDVRLTPDFISKLLSAGEVDSRAGSVCGKLLAMEADFEVPPAPRFDSTGIYMTPNLRHFDRGSQTPDHGQYDRIEYVFGATGAACLYRLEMIEDISVGGEFFDADFFAYREDADVAWRAQLLGWRCLYTPLAVAYHVRSVLPRNRRSVAAVLNMHSVKNRWLLRIKNMTPDLYRRYWWPITMRDLMVIGGCLLWEFRSLKAFWLVFRAWGRTWQKRREIMRRRRATDAEIAGWFEGRFGNRPAGLQPAPQSSTG
jgi:GT2 family glycosyltransferase